MKGYMHPRGDNCFRFMVYRGKDAVTGKKRYTTETFHGKQGAAEKRLNEIVNQINKETFVEPVKETFGQYLRRWLAFVRPRVEQTTYDMYESLCRVHIIPCLGNIQLQKLAPFALDRFYSDRLEAPKVAGKPGMISANTVKHIHDVIRIAIRQAVRWQLLFRNVAEAVTPPKVTRKKPAAWTPDEAARFLQDLSGDRYYAAFLLAVQAGLRRGEILGLRWQDIDWLNEAVSIEQALVKTSAGNVLKGPKTKDSQGMTALSEATLEALRERAVAQGKERRAFETLAGPGTYENTDLVFTREDGHFIRPDYLTRYFKKRLGQSRVPRICFRDQRHTAATLMMNAGTDIKIVSDQLRHADISTTTKFYVGPIPEPQKRAARAVDELLGLNKDGRLPKDYQTLIQ